MKIVIKKNVYNMNSQCIKNEIPVSLNKILKRQVIN